MTNATDIVCFERGSGDGEPWQGSPLDIGLDIAALETLSKNQIIDLQFEDGLLCIRGMTHIGLVILPSGRRLIIRTKIPNLVVLEWLAYLGLLPSLQFWLQEDGIALGDNFHISIGKLFLRELDVVGRRHIRKDYVTQSLASSYVRGKILVSQLSNQFHRLPQVPTVHRSRSFDTVYNTVLGLALDKLCICWPEFSVADRTLHARLRDQWSSIDRENSDPVAASGEALWACPPGYRSAIQLARFILRGLSLDLSSSFGGQAFTLPLAQIWEGGLRKIFSELQDRTGWIAKRNRTRWWDDYYGANDSKRRLVADIILEKQSARWVLDAKYKCSFGDEGRGDRFQMCAYALAFDASRCTLVYPTGDAEVGVPRSLLETTIGSKSISIQSVQIPMSRGPESCSRVLEQFCNNQYLA